MLSTPDAAAKAHRDPSTSTRPTSDVATRLALSHHIDSRPTPPPAGTSFGLVVITPPPCDPNVPRHDPGDEPGMRHPDVEYRPTATAAH